MSLLPFYYFGLSAEEYIWRFSSASRNEQVIVKGFTLEPKYKLLTDNQKYINENSMNWFHKVPVVFYFSKMLYIYRYVRFLVGKSKNNRVTDKESKGFACLCINLNNCRSQDTEINKCTPLANSRILSREISYLLFEEESPRFYTFRKKNNPKLYILTENYYICEQSLRWIVKNVCKN